VKGLDKLPIQCAYSSVPCSRCPVKIRTRCGIRVAYDNNKDKLKRYQESIREASGRRIGESPTKLKT
jgi:hypothetical protein